jgi:hypothetical protein
MDSSEGRLHARVSALDEPSRSLAGVTNGEELAGTPPSSLLQAGLGCQSHHCVRLLVRFCCLP